MDQNIATADFCLKFDHRKLKLYVYINKLQITSEMVKIDKASLSFHLFPTDMERISQRKKRHKNDIYFTYFEKLAFKDIDPAEVGSMGLVVKVFSHVGIMKNLRQAGNYQPLDNLDLTSRLSRVILPLYSQEKNYEEEHNRQALSITQRKTTEVRTLTISSEDPMLAVSFKHHRNISCLDVYIQRLTRLELYIKNGYIFLEYRTHSTNVVSSNRSEAMQFTRDNLIHMSISLDTKNSDLEEGGVFLQICPLKKKDIQIQSVEFQRGQGVLYAMFGLENFSTASARLLWIDLLNDTIDPNNRWHMLKIGGIP